MSALLSQPYKGKTIYMVDISNLQTEKSIRIFKEPQKQITTHAPKNVLLITDVSMMLFQKIQMK